MLPVDVQAMRVRSAAMARDTWDVSANLQKISTRQTLTES